jgi:hypothetical protein
MPMSNTNMMMMTTMMPPQQQFITQPPTQVNNHILVQPRTTTNASHMNHYMQQVSILHFVLYITKCQMFRIRRHLVHYKSMRMADQ